MCDRGEERERERERESRGGGGEGAQFTVKQFL